MPFIPFSKSLQSSGKKSILVLLFLLIISIVVMRHFGAPLVNSACKKGIVSFELAKRIENSQAILNSWNEPAKISAALSLGFDFVFLVLYSLFVALLIYKLKTGLWKNKWLYRFGNVLIWAAFLMALSDSIENIALIRLLQGDIRQVWASTAYFFAVLKFSLLAICVLYILVGFGFLLFKKIRNA
jgi:hypothetical protein